VLAALGISPELRGGALRISLGYESQQVDVDHAVEIIPDSVEALRRAGVEMLS